MCYLLCAADGQASLQGMTTPTSVITPAGGRLQRYSCTVKDSAPPWTGISVSSCLSAQITSSRSQNAGGLKALDLSLMRQLLTAKSPDGVSAVWLVVNDEEVSGG